MKVTVLRPTDIEVARVRCVLPYDEEDFRYQELADFPGRAGNSDRGTITLEIDLDTSRVVGWPEGRHASLYLKVRDEGVYTLIGTDGGAVREHYGHVPGWLPGDDNTLFAAIGDYFIADLQGDGTIWQDGKPWKADTDEIAAWLDGLLDDGEY